MATYTKQGDVFLTRKKFEQLAKDGQLVKGTIYHLLDASFAIETIEGLSTKLDLAPLVEMSILTEDDNVYIVSHKQNIYTGTTNEQQMPLQLANATQAGLMSSADYATLANLTERVHALEGKTTRILYTASNMPSAEEINAFATGLGYEAPYRGVAIVIDNTFHVWHYYENDNIGWRDDGLDAVNAFTTGGAGTIRGAQTDGKVFAETDGTGSVFGWAELKARVANLETGKQDKLVIDEMPQEGSTNVVTSGGAYQHAHETANAAYNEAVGVGKRHTNEQIVAFSQQRQLSNPNLFINPDFHINQRRHAKFTRNDYVNQQLFSKGIVRYMADLWQLYSSDLEAAPADKPDESWTVERVTDGIKCTMGANCNRIILTQSFSLRNGSRFLKRPLTFSVCATQNSGEPVICSLTMQIDEYVLNGEQHIYGEVQEDGTTIPRYAFFSGQEGVGSYLRIHTPNHGGYLSFDIYVMPNETLTIHWAKLEYGSIYTPYEAPNWGEELQKCRYYYQEVSNRRLPACYGGTGSLVWYVPLIPAMADIPTITLDKTNVTLLAGGGGNRPTFNANDLITAYIQQDGFNIQMAKDSLQADNATWVALLEVKQRKNGVPPIIAFVDSIM